MPEALEEDFNLPWCKRFFDDPSFEPVDTFSRVANGEGGENSLLAISLHTPNTIRACKSFIKRTADRRPLGSSSHVLFSLGTGLNSIAGVCHGSIVTLMFDEAFGQLMADFFDRDLLITAELSVSFKRPLRTPAVVVCTAWIEKDPEGRKTWMAGDIRDGHGLLLAQGTSLYLRRKAKGHL